MKRLLTSAALFLCSLVAFAQFSGSGNGTENDPYLIFNENQLAQLSNFLNQEGVVFKLMKDLDLTNWIAENNPKQGWIPIGVESSPFKGIFNGNNHKISGMFINRSSSGYVGLFGYMSGVTINDLTIEGTTITGASNTGVLAGYAENANITNCQITMRGELGVTGSSNVGALVGYISSSTISNCHIKIEGGNGVTGTTPVGGLTGYSSNTNYQTISVTAKVSGSQGRIGGIVGKAEKAGSLSNGSFVGVVAGIGNNTGGLIGIAIGQTLTNITVKGTISGQDYTGGIVGSCQNGNYTNCNFEGELTGAQYVGGIAGALLNTSSSFSSCYTKGKITATGDYAGGIVGVSQGACIEEMESCSHFGDIKGHDFVGGLIGAIVSDDIKPQLSTYTVWSDRTGSKPSGTLLQTTEETIINGEKKSVGINNCVSICNLEGNNMIGGLIGSDLSSYGYTSEVFEAKYGLWGTKYLFKDRVFTGIERRNYGEITYRYSYSRNSVSYSLTNNYYSGTIQGADYVGGIVGIKGGGEIKTNYSYATIYGSSNVGGIVGATTAQTASESYSEISIKSNVAICQVISATNSNLGRLYGTIKGEDKNYVTIGALASAEGNRALTQTRVILQGVVQEVDDDLQNGTSIGPSLLRLKATYVAIGWDFDNNWNILETESYPYKKYQAAPPVIESDLVSQNLGITGKSINGGTVYLYYKDQDPVSTICNGHQWTFSTKPLQSGAMVKVYADVEGMTPSYFSTTFVGYPGSGTEEDPYRIYTAEDLQGASNRGYYKLMNDINLTSWINENSPTEGWPAIGRNSGEVTYIDGDGHKVTGLWIDTKENFNGLFSNFSAGQIKNLTVEVASGKKVKGGDYTGILIGRNANGSIVNCTIKGEVEGTSHTGGVVGYVENSTVKAVLYEGSVSGVADEAHVGGLIGETNECSVIACNAISTINTSGNDGMIGGLIGLSKEGSVSKSRAKTTLTAEGTSCYVGGLIGYSETPVTLCYSDGSVTASDNDTYSGGLVGYAKSAIDNSYSSAKSTGTLYSAGLVAYSYNSIDKCYAEGDVYGSRYGAGVVGELDGINAVLTNSVASNNIVSLSDQSSWGCRVIGGYKNGAPDPDYSNYALSTMQVSLNNEPQKKTDDIVEGRAMTKEVLMKQNTYKQLGWDFESVWKIDESASYPYQDEVIADTELDDPDEPDNPDEPETIDVTDISSYSDAIYAEAITSQPGGEVTLTICLKNAQSASAYSFDLQLPEGVTLATKSNGDYQYTKSNRHNGHSETVNYNSESGVYSFAVLSLLSKEVKGNDGEIWTLKLKVSDKLVDGIYCIKILNAKYSLLSGSSKVSMPEVISTLSVKSYIKGDVNGDGDVDIADAVCIVNNVVGIATPSYVAQAADVNGDGDVDIADAVRIINLVVGKIQSLSRALSRGSNSLSRAVEQKGNSTDAIYINDTSVYIGKENALTVSLKNSQTTNAYSFDFILPEGLSIVQDEKGEYQDGVSYMLSDRHDGHAPVLNYRGNNTYSFAILSLQSKELTGNDGVICTFKIKVNDSTDGGQYPVKIQNAKYSLLSGESKVKMSETEGQLTVKILGDVNSDGELSKEDVNAIANHIIGDTPDNFDEEAADVNGDKEINAADIVKLVDLLGN